MQPNYYNFNHNFLTAFLDFELTWSLFIKGHQQNRLQLVSGMNLCVKVHKS